MQPNTYYMLRKRSMLSSIGLTDKGLGLLFLRWHLFLLLKGSPDLKQDISKVLI